MCSATRWSMTPTAILKSSPTPMTEARLGASVVTQPIARASRCTARRHVQPRGTCNAATSDLCETFTDEDDRVLWSARCSWRLKSPLGLYFPFGVPKGTLRKCVDIQKRTPHQLFRPTCPAHLPLSTCAHDNFSVDRARATHDKRVLVALGKESFRSVASSASVNVASFTMKTCLRKCSLREIVQMMRLQRAVCCLFFGLSLSRWDIFLASSKCHF